MEQLHRYPDKLPYKIPSSSDLFGNYNTHHTGTGSHPDSALEVNPFRPLEYQQTYAHPYSMTPSPLPTDQPHYYAPRGHTPVHELPRPPYPPQMQMTPVPTSAPYRDEPPLPSPPPLNCVSICSHVQACPVCSQLYKPYTGIYMMIIAILVIIILFLLKKIFNF